MRQYNGKSAEYLWYGRQKGKKVHIYHFGGKGNDWCFVRTPPTYNPDREKPYPFVICNHGNGWVMDGTPEKANWTKRTMYVPLDDPDYINNLAQFSGTENQDLWYSNPTIEKLLDAGYIVCGCENYGDNLYGNNPCRNACAEFFYHMTENYNVEKRCCMIGASNGALTTLNACYLLGELVKAVILQYPLTCLTAHYLAYPKHRKGILSAYGITDPSITEKEFIRATRTHDVMYTDVVSNIKIGYFPPVKIWYSRTDNVVSYAANAENLYTLLENSLKVVEKVKVDVNGEIIPHGDYRMFDPAGFVTWFDKY